MERVLYQTWKSKTVPPQYQKGWDKWDQWCRSHNYKHVLLDDNDLRVMVATTFPSFLDFYDRLSITIEKVDFARYAMMYKGGIYADMDTYPTQDITPFIDLNTIVLGREPLEHSRELYQREVVICNAFMISPPGKSFWKYFCEFIISRYEPNYKPVETTGPMALTKFYESQPEKFSSDRVLITDPCTFFPMTAKAGRSKFCPDESKTYVIHEWSASWTAGNFSKDPQIYNRRYWKIIACIIIGLAILYFAARLPSRLAASFYGF